MNKMENFFKTCGPLPENNYNDGKKFKQFIISNTSSASTQFAPDAQERTIYGGNNYKL